MVNQLIKRLDCMVIGHRMHSEVTIKDYGIVRLHSHLITCSHCGKFFFHDCRTENIIESVPNIKCC